jgi:hypothetical protein
MTDVPGIEPQTSHSQVQHSTTRPCTPCLKYTFYVILYLPYMLSRFPVVTWRHPRTKAVLLRASGFHGKGVMGMLKGHHTQPTGRLST